MFVEVYTVVQFAKVADYNHTPNWGGGGEAVRSGLKVSSRCSPGRLRMPMKTQDSFMSGRE